MIRRSRLNIAIRLVMLPFIAVPGSVIIGIAEAVKAFWQYLERVPPAVRYVLTGETQ